MKKTYTPHKYQKMFHKSSARFRSLIAGRRGGKTLAGNVEAIWMADQQPCLGWVIAPTYKMLKDINIPLMLDWIPPEAIVNYNKTDNKLELINGSTIGFRSAEDPNKLRGVGLDWLWLDEACFMTPEVWQVVYPSLADKKGIAWITTTPKGYDWVYQNFVRPAKNGNEDYEYWAFQTIENPVIDKEIIEKAKEEMTDQMFRQEFLATFESFSGLVYPDFDEKVHTFKDGEHKGKPGDNWYIGIDVGWTNPTAVLLIAEDEDRNLWVVDELYEPGLTVPEASEKIRELVHRNNMVLDDIQMFLIDPASRGTHQSAKQYTDTSVLDQFQENLIPVIPGNNDVLAGISRVTELLRTGKLHISQKCVNLIKELMKYSWMEKSIGEETNLNEKPKKAFDHAVDALRYVVQSRPDKFDRGEVDEHGKPIQPIGQTEFVDERDEWQSIL